MSEARTLAERIKREHWKSTDDGEHCGECVLDWPCDAIQLADAVLAQPDGDCPHCDGVRGLIGPATVWIHANDLRAILDREQPK